MNRIQLTINIIICKIYSYCDTAYETKTNTIPFTNY